MSDLRAMIDAQLAADLRHRELDTFLQGKLDELLGKSNAAARERSPVGASLYGLPVMTSDLVKPGEVLLVSPPPYFNLEPGADPRVDVIRLTRAGAAYYNPRNAAGYPSAIERALRPVPGYTDRTVAAREAARDWRRHRRRR